MSKSKSQSEWNILNSLKKSEEGLTQKTVSERTGYSQTTVSSILNEFSDLVGFSGTDNDGILKHSIAEDAEIEYNPPCSNYHTLPTGYGYWDNCGERVYEHQLLACLNHDPHKVFADDTHVHHGSGGHDSLPAVEHPRANWEGNLQVMDSSDHWEHHMVKYWSNHASSDDRKEESGKEISDSNIEHNSALDW